jgi:hypothetical protein
MEFNFGELKIILEIQDTKTSYYFHGNVDESFQFKKLPPPTTNLVEFELEGIQNFNSVGIREWIRFMKSIPSSSKIVFKNCSIPMMDEINMVPDCLGHASIESFFAPYYCKDHGESKKLISIIKHASELNSGKAPHFTCNTCNKNLEFDALEESYFLFFTDILRTKKTS